MRPRLSIPRRVFLGFALVLTVSGLVSVASVVQHQRTAATLSLLHEGYLPLSLVVSECRATQSVFGNLLERMSTDRNTSATRIWLNSGRRARPLMLQQALDRIAEMEGLAPPATERTTLSRLRRDLKRVQRAMTKGEERYDELYRALDGEDRTTAERVLADLRVRERVIDGRLRAAWNTILGRIDATSEAAAEEQQQAIFVLVVLGAVALLVGIAVTIWSQRVLASLPRLQRRVEAVARGDLAQQLEPVADDEIGRLSQQFEQMVAAISARDKSLREAAETQRRLQQMQAQILADLSAAVLVVDAAGLLLTRNPAAQRLLGLTEQVLGTPLLSTDLRARLPELVRAIDQVAREGGTAQLTEERLPGTDETLPERLLNIFVTPFGIERSQDRRQVLMVAEDVTESVRTKARLIQSERLAAVGRMAAHVTHEVRNPLSSIGLNVELLEDELSTAGPEAKELVNAIQREIERLRALTEEYLRVARLPTPDLENVDLGLVVRATADFVKREFNAADIEIAFDIATPLPEVAIDEGQIRQVILNLMKNARDAMVEGGVLSIAVRAERGGVELDIADNGAGIEEAQRARIFDLFYTTKKLGTGLGLPLSQQIVLAHGGTIRCESAIGQGTRFCLWFPAVDNDSAGGPSMNGASSHSTNSSSVGRSAKDALAQEKNL